MKGRSILINLLALGSLLALVAGLALAQGPGRESGAGPQAGLGTEFTYQGRLIDGGSPAEGDYDFRFILYDAEVAGSQVGGIAVAEDVPVTEGLFTVALDFGGAAFDGQARWLEIGVRPGDSTGGYTTLSPRQALTAAPYALYARVAPWGGLSGVPAGFADDIDDDELGGLSCSNGQVAKWNSTLVQWQCGDDQTGAGGGSWSLTGNAGTTASNFLGTTDSQALELRVNNARALRLEPNATSPNVIGGYSGNSVTGGVVGATIGGGGNSSYPNQVTGGYATVGGGRGNSADEVSATVGGGESNTASGEASTIAGGVANTADVEFSTIGGGSDNVASELYVTVAGGIGNQGLGESSAIGGGDHNVATSWGATVGGGIQNDASGDRATIGGGKENTASAQYATVAGGDSNTASGQRATVGGGGGNTANNSYATTGGGLGNAATGDSGTVGGGQDNTAAGKAATVGGGQSNTASSSYTTVGGGWGNEASGYAATIGGGDSNMTSHLYATIAGGYNITVTAGYATVGGGENNTASGFGHATVGGGQHNIASNQDATVGGGSTNTASGLHATIGGGAQNTAGYSSDTVGGGYWNTASSGSATVSGGEYNIASGHTAAVGGGEQNTASGQRATVGGGRYNTASGDYATVPGGGYNTAQGNYSFAAGRRAKANHQGSFVLADSTDADLASTASNQFIVRASGGFWFGATSSPSIPAGRFINTSTGAYLSTGGAWTDSSDRESKENFSPVDGSDLLARLAEVPIQSWNYKAEDPAVRHLGPVAQDFYAAFGLGEDNQHISTVDTAGVALATIQALHQRNQELEAENAAQQQQLADLEARMAALEQAVQAHDAPLRFTPGWLFGGLVLAGLVVGGRRRWGGGRP